MSNKSKATDNKTMAVDVLAVLRQIADGEGDAQVLAMRVHAAVAELIEALDLAAYGEYLPESVEQQIRTSLARVRGESA
jgi:hypothetical protein